MSSLSDKLLCLRLELLNFTLSNLSTRYPMKLRLPCSFNLLKNPRSISPNTKPVGVLALSKSLRIHNQSYPGQQPQCPKTKSKPRRCLYFPKSSLLLKSRPLLTSPFKFRMRRRRNYNLTSSFVFCTQPHQKITITTRYSSHSIFIGSATASSISWGWAEMICSSWVRRILWWS